MADVRLTATNPENSQAVPVACNSKGEVLLASPELGGDAVLLDDGGTKQVIQSGGLGISDGTTENITLNATGNAAFAAGVVFAGNVEVGGDPRPAVAEDGALVQSLGRYSARRSGGETIWSGYQTGDLITSEIKADGKASFSDSVTAGAFFANKDLTPASGINIETFYVSSGGIIQSYDRTNSVWKPLCMKSSGWFIDWDGSATFERDVVIGSRNKQWKIVESGGIAHLVEQESSLLQIVEDSEDPEGSNTYPELRNLPQELTMVEEQLQKVMERLRMVPEAGWEVWDGSD